MTRINVGIPPKSLCRQHLMAEHYELKRIPNAVKSGRANMSGIPIKFTLGTGHVKFFYNKLGYLLKRYKEIYQECLNRGYNVTDFTDSWTGIPQQYMQDYTPTEADIQLLRDRINEKLADMGLLGHQLNNNI